MKWYLKVLRQYADFEGRARRQEYWNFVLFNVFFAFVAGILIAIVAAAYGRAPILVYYYFYMFAVMLPGLAVTVRRLHDTGRSGWFILVNLIPLIGAIWLLVLLATDGEAGSNRYGLNPKESDETNTFNRQKSVAVTLVVTCAIWFFTTFLEHITIFGVMRNLSDYLTSVFPLYLMLPIGLIIAGSLWLKNGRLEKKGAYALISSSALWIILLLFTLNSPYKNYLNIAYQLLLAAGLMMLGVSVIQQKENRKVISGLLTLGAALFVISLIHRAWIMPLSFSMNDYTAILRFYTFASVMISPVCFYYLGMWVNNPEVYQSSTQAAEAPYGSAQPLSGQTAQKQMAQPSGPKRYNERDNKGMRVNTFSESMSYWMVERLQSPRKDPFVYYVFQSPDDPHAAMLELPFIHLAADTGKLISDELFCFGYFAITNDGVLTGEYDAFIAGADMTYDQWEKIHEVFARHNGVKKNDQEPEKTAKSVSSAGGNAGNVSFVREDRDATSTWRVYKASSKADAMAFLSGQQVTKPLYYIVVETPEGNFGRDISGFYQE